MKIVYSMPAVMLCGGSVHHFFVIQRLVARGHEVSIYTPLLQDLELLPKLPDSVKIHCHKKVSSSLYTLPSEKKPIQFLKVLKDLTIGLNHIANDLPSDADVIQGVFYPNLIAAEKMRRKKGSKAALIQAIHISPKVFLPMSYRRYHSLWGKSPYLADHIFAVCEMDAEYLRKTYNKPATMVGNGLDDEILTGEVEDRKEIEPILNLDGKPYLIFVGSITGRKGIDIILKAFSIVRNSFPDFSLVLVGKGNWKPYYHNLALQEGVLDNVRHIPGADRKTLRRLLDHASCFLYPSRAEGFGIPPLEGMARGLPVVCTPSDGLSEFARENENCLMVPPEDYSQFAEAIKRILKDHNLAVKMGNNGKETAKLFTWDVVADRTEKGMLSLLENRK